MKYSLDTNICIAWIKGEDLSLREKIISHHPRDLSICSIVKAELLYGALKSKNRIKNEHLLSIFFSNIQSLTFNDEAAGFYASLRISQEKMGATIGPNDLLIASIALQNQLTLVTRNENEFKQIPHLKVEVW